MCLCVSIYALSLKSIGVFEIEIFSIMLHALAVTCNLIYLADIEKKVKTLLMVEGIVNV